jgi:hypothetical protein
MFDGHLEKPLKEMTVRQRLDWLSDAALLLHTGRLARLGDRTAVRAPMDRSRLP